MEPGPVKLPEKSWTKDDPYRYSLPKPNTLPQRSDDIWENCLAPLQKEDEEQCRAWREEVQNLLIFAGLFSAVVTTFVVDSYKNLMPSSDQRTVDLLSQIVSRLDNSSTNLNASSASLSFSPSASSVRVNALWFMSLVISLTTALVGIVALQWLREYERYSGHWTAKQVFEIRNMRHESMNRSFVPQIFTGLPLLLQGALILFFVGLMDFLFHLYPNAGLPTIGVVSITLSFLVFTTVLPALQYCITFQNQHSDIPSTPFPYKSPQSWIILIMAMRVRWFLHLYKYYWQRLRDRSSHRLQLPIPSNWTLFDRARINSRSMQTIPGHTSDDNLDGGGRGEITYHYDTLHGIAHVVSNYCQSNPLVALSAYHCFLEQQKTKSALHCWAPQSQRHLYRCLEPRNSFLLPNITEIPGFSMPQAEDITLMVFLGMFQRHSASISGFSSLIYRQEMELWIRMNATLGFPYHGQGSRSLTVISHKISAGLRNPPNEVLDEGLALQLILLYKKLVMIDVKPSDDIPDLAQRVRYGGIAAVIATMAAGSIPSFVRLRHLVEPLHVALAERTLQSWTGSEFAHCVGSNWVEIALYELVHRPLPEWSEDYKEAFSFLVTAVYKTVGRHQGVFHDPYSISRMKAFLDNLSPDMRDRIAQRCKNVNPE